MPKTFQATQISEDIAEKTLTNSIMIQPLFLGLGMQEILIILAIVLLLFGGKKIPELMRGAGKGVRAFKDGMKEPTTDDDMKNDEKKSDEVNDEK